jgi:molybdenum cofactor cytidylyltransferase
MAVAEVITVGAISAIVLAAGQATRFGQCKQLMMLDGKPLLRHTLDRVNESKVDDVVVVLGAFADAIQRQIRFGKERVVINHDFELGMSTSLHAGLRALAPGTNAVVIALGDQPFVTSATIDNLIDAYGRSRSKIIVPTFNGQRGNPVLVDQSLFPRMMEIRGDVGCRAIFTAVPVAELAVDDAGVTADIDTMEDFECRMRHSS